MKKLLALLAVTLLSANAFAGSFADISLPDLKAAIAAPTTAAVLLEPVQGEGGARAVPAILAALESEGVRVASVTVARPSLDDVYLRHAGTAFSEADVEVTR